MAPVIGLNNENAAFMHLRGVKEHISRRPHLLSYKRLCFGHILFSGRIDTPATARKNKSPLLSITALSASAKLNVIGGKHVEEISFARDHLRDAHELPSMGGARAA